MALDFAQLRLGERDLVQVLQQILTVVLDRVANPQEILYIMLFAHALLQELPL